MAGRFSLFQFTKPGKGVKKEDVPKETPTGFLAFFPLYGSKFWNLSSLNLLYVIFNFPVLFGLFALTGNISAKTKGVSTALAAPLYGMMMHHANPVTSMLNGMLGNNVEILVPTLLTKVFYALTLLVLLTFGFANTGMTYILRGYVRHEPVYVLSDFLDVIKRNLKQAFLLGILDLIILTALAWDIVFWRSQLGFVNEMMFFASLFLLIIYILMRFYMYIIMITFDLSIRKILKNSLIFAFLGFKRNMVAIVGIAAVALTNLYFYFLFPLMGCVFPFVITLSTTAFIAAYAAYPTIQKIMIDPYYKEEPKKYVEPLYTDMG